MDVSELGIETIANQVRKRWGEKCPKCDGDTFKVDTMATYELHLKDLALPYLFCGGQVVNRVWCAECGEELHSH